MRKSIVICIIILLLVMIGCSPSPGDEEKGDPSLNEYIDPFKLENLVSYDVVVRGENGAGGLIEAVPPFHFSETGLALAGALNNSLGELMFVPGIPSDDLVIRMGDGEKRVSVKYGFYIQFSEGDVTTEYFLKDPSEDLIDAFNALVEEAEELFWEGVH